MTVFLTKGKFSVSYFKGESAVEGLYVRLGHHLLWLSSLDFTGYQVESFIVL